MCTTLSQLFPGKLYMLFFTKGQVGVALISRYVSRYVFVLRMCLRTVNFWTHLSLTLNLPRFLLQLPTQTASSLHTESCSLLVTAPNAPFPFHLGWLFTYEKAPHLGTWVSRLGSQGDKGLCSIMEHVHGHPSFDREAGKLLHLP